MVFTGSRIPFFLLLFAVGGALAFSFYKSGSGPENCPPGEVGNGPFFDESFSGAWQGTMSQGGRSTPLRLDLNIEGGCLGVRVSMPEAALFYLPAEDLAVDEGTLTFAVPGAPYEIEATGLVDGAEITGIWGHTRNGVEARFVLTRRSPDPVVLKTRDVSFSSPDGAALAGTLILPDGEGPFPAVVWTHGSGPDTRETAYYASRGYLAASLGMAALIYDKRGSGESTGNAPWDIYNLMADAEAGVQALRADEDIRADFVGVGGYSQGGWISPAVTAKDPGVAFVIVGSAPGITPAEQNVYSLYTRAREAYGEETAQAVAEGLRRVYAYYQTGEGYEEVLAFLNLEGNRAWSGEAEFRRFFFTPDNNLPPEVNPEDWRTLFYNPLPDWREVKGPVKGFWGANDINVPAEKSRDLISAALNQGGNTQWEFQVYQGADHGLMREIPVPEGEYDWNRADPGYIEAFSTWIKARVNEATQK